MEWRHSRNVARSSGQHYFPGGQHYIPAHTPGQQWLFINVTWRALDQSWSRISDGDITIYNATYFTVHGPLYGFTEHGVILAWCSSWLYYWHMKVSRESISSCPSRYYWVTPALTCYLHTTRLAWLVTVATHGLTARLIYSKLVNTLQYRIHNACAGGDQLSLPHGTKQKTPVDSKPFWLCLLWRSVLSWCNTDLWP